jgi:branched-chain amino acid transport system ATP-binding protein
MAVAATPGTRPHLPVDEPPALDVVGLRTGYDDTLVLRDMSIRVPQRSVVALLGPNGAGKTTCLRAVSGLLKAWHGEIRMRGQDITQRPAYLRFAAGLCHIPEGRGIFSSLTVRENLMLFAPRRTAREPLTIALDAFPILARRMHQRAGSMSGGEQQMLAMAAAYIRQPQLVLVDEASLGLSPVMIDEVFGFIRRIAQAGSSVLIVDQFVHRALEVADTAYILRRGEIVAEGPASGFRDMDLSEQYLGTSLPN